MTSVPSPTTHLEPDACWRLLRSTDVGRLAVVVGKRPEIFPVNYAVDHGTVVYRSGRCRHFARPWEISSRSPIDNRNAGRGAFARG